MTQPVTLAIPSRILLSVDDLDFAALYERHARDVYRFSLYLSGDFALAEDVTAETFARAWVARVLAALRRIPEHEREVLLMATVEALRHQAIAVALDLSIDAVKVRVHRARVRLNALRAGMEINHVHYTTRHP